MCSRALGAPWACFARYNNVNSSVSQNGNGYCWDVASWPKVQASSWTGANIMFRNSGGKMEYMKTGTTPGSFDALFGNQNVLTQNTSTGEFTLQMSDGSSMLFNSLSKSLYHSNGDHLSRVINSVANNAHFVVRKVFKARFVLC